MSIEKIDAEKIHREISKHVNKDVTYIDALVEYAQRNDIEIEVIGDIVRRSNILKAKLRQNAEDLRLVEKTTQLKF